MPTRRVPFGTDAPPAPGPPSVFAAVANRSGTSLLTTKRALSAFSHVVEEECRYGAPGAYLFGAFQRAEFYERARSTWQDLTATARAAYVFADFGATRPPRPGEPVEVDLDPQSPIHREWAIVVDAATHPMVLVARERSGQDGTPDRDRLFDSTWSTDADTVRRAARICALVASSAESPGADAVLYALATPPVPGEVDPGLRDRMLDRLLVLVGS